MKTTRREFLALIGNVTHAKRSVEPVLSVNPIDAALDADLGVARSHQAQFRTSANPGRRVAYREARVLAE